MARQPVGRASGTRRRLLRRVLWWIVGIALLGGVGWYFATREPAETAVRPGRFGAGGPVAVAVAAAESGDMPLTLNALGTVTPLATVTVRSRIAGQLTQIAFEEGQTVQPGDLLAQIDPRPYQLALDQARAQLVRDQAQLANAQLDLARYQRLMAQDSIARQQLDTQRALVLQYQGAIAMDQAQVETAELNLEYCRITAPIGGRVGLRQTDLGNYVQVGDSSGIVVITQMQPITVTFTVAQDSLPSIMARLNAGATLAVTAYDRGRTAELATGTLSAVDNQIDTTTGTVRMRAQFENHDQALFPNQFVNVQLLVDTLRDATLVPVSAIQRGAPGTFVYLVGPDGTVAVRPVTIGPSSGQRTVVLSGLTPGDTVVTDGADRLREGARVTVPGASPPASPTGQEGRGARAGHGSGSAAAAEPPAPATADTPAAAASAGARSDAASAVPTAPVASGAAHLGGGDQRRQP